MALAGLDLEEGPAGGEVADFDIGPAYAVGVSPGTIDTPMLAASCEGWNAPVEELYAQVEQKIPVRRLGQPDDIAKAAAFLLSDAAAYVNGTILTLDGGTMALPPW